MGMPTDNKTINHLSKILEQVSKPQDAYALFSEADIKRHFTPQVVTRGKQYFKGNRVLEVTTLNQQESGWVSVSGFVAGKKDAYYVRIALHPRDDNTGCTIDSCCDCYEEYYCKHAVALLYQIAEDNELRWLKPSLAGYQQEQQTQASPLTDWLSSLKEQLSTQPTQKPKKSYEEKVIYQLFIKNLYPDNLTLHVSVQIARVLKKGGLGKPKNFSFSPQQMAKCPLKERGLLHQLQALSHYELDSCFPLTNEESMVLLTELLNLAPDRCFWAQHGAQLPLQLGPQVQAPFQWSMDERGKQTMQLNTQQALTVLPTRPLWYLNESDGLCGPLLTDPPTTQALQLLAMPAVPVEQVPAVITTLKETFSDIELPLPQKLKPKEHKKVEPVPCLRLSAIDVTETPRHHWEIPKSIKMGVAELQFMYHGLTVPAFDTEKMLYHYTDNQLSKFTRDTVAEEKAVQQLTDAGLTPLCLSDLPVNKKDYPHYFASSSLEDNAQLSLCINTIPQLKASGWEIQVDEDYEWYVIQADEWYTAVDDSSDIDWFSLEVGIQVDGEKINMLPLLLDFLQRNNLATVKKQIENGEMDINTHALLSLPDGRHLSLPVKKLIEIASVLTELYDSRHPRSETLELSRARAAELLTLETILAEGACQTRWLGGENIRKLGQQLKNFTGIKSVKVPKSFKATLRPYQEKGVNWLQFLRQFNLNGILADDMGLGKTVQTLALLLTEKKAKRMTLPCLIIAPTSLMANWRHEAAQFAPSLKVLVLQGDNRHDHFDSIAEHDVVLTTYPLLSRDKELLLAQKYYYLILDEAQAIKNTKARVTQVVHQLQSTHRLCLTGTPMENHLGELWSLMHFLMPGLLGTAEKFKQLFRTPIEKHQDTERQQSLMRRIKPFILRRTKEVVMTELPEKTAITRTVAMTEEQQTLYESIRVAMHDRIQKAIQDKGLARSHITVLDALLKLRQVCCHPGLLSLSSAKSVKTSAKFELLMSLLPNLIEEGRRVLLFSQFTSMLALIEEAVQQLQIDYVKLTGSTRNRDEPIQRFQSGAVPLFLISLKAGGVGLNLTAADTVIHYDPWWNPAVEQQATDRAHRMGQDKAVFVYKLITENSVEEKILELQERKKTLYKGVLDNKQAQTSFKLTQDDIQALFEPLPV